MKLTNAIELFQKLPEKIKEIRIDLLEIETSKFPIEKKLSDIKAHFITIINSAQKDGKLLYTNEKLRQSQLQVMLENDDTAIGYTEVLNKSSTLIKNLHIELELKNNQFRMLNTLIPLLHD